MLPDFWFQLFTSPHGTASLSRDSTIIHGRVTSLESITMSFLINQLELLNRVRPSASYMQQTLFKGKDIFWNSSSLPVPKTNALEQYDTRVRVVSFYTTQGLG
jgi:hypothetical protein